MDSVVTQAWRNGLPLGQFDWLSGFATVFAVFICVVSDTLVVRCVWRAVNRRGAGGPLPGSSAFGQLACAPLLVGALGVPGFPWLMVHLPLSAGLAAAIGGVALALALVWGFINWPKNLAKLVLVPTSALFVASLVVAAFLSFEMVPFKRAQLQAAFGPVIESTLPVDDDGWTPLFDPDQNQLVPDTNPRNPAFNPVQRLTQLRKPGLAIQNNGQITIYGMSGLGIQFPDAQAGDQWQKITDMDNLNGILGSEGTVPGGMQMGTVPNKLPLSFFFKTSATNVGLLQITRFIKNPRTLNIRYKMLLTGNEPRAKGRYDMLQNRMTFFALIIVTLLGTLLLVAIGALLQLRRRAVATPSNPSADEFLEPEPLFRRLAYPLAVIAWLALFGGVVFLRHVRNQNSANSPGRVPTLAESPQDLLSASTPAVIQAGLSEPQTPWPWLELEKRAKAGQVSAPVANAFLDDLATWMRRDYPHGYDSPVPWLDQVLNALNDRHFLAETNVLGFLEAYCGNPSIPPLPRVREGDKSILFSCKWRSPFINQGLLGFQFLNQFRSITIDGQTVPARDFSGGSWNSVEYDNRLELLNLPPGKHTIRCEVESAFVPIADMAGLASGARIEDWPPANRRWTRVCQADFVVYAKDAVLVSLSDDPALDPAAADALTAAPIIIRSRNGHLTAVVSLQATPSLDRPISVNVTLHVGGQIIAYGSQWTEKHLEGKAESTRGNSNWELTADIGPLDPQVKEAEIVLAPDPKAIESNPGVTRIWGKDIILPHVPLTRQDLSGAPLIRNNIPVLTTAAYPSKTFGPVIERSLPDFSVINLVSGQVDAIPQVVLAQDQNRDAGDRAATDTWMGSRGMDIANFGAAGLVGLHMTMPALKAGDWDSYTADMVTDSLYQRPTAGHYVLQARSFGAATNFTCVFKTSTDQMGILQITGFTYNPRNVKIRYKLVQSSATTVTPVSRPPAAAQNLSFGPVMERVVTAFDDNPAQACLDFGSGEFRPPPAALADRIRLIADQERGEPFTDLGAPGDDRYDWLKTSGVDLIGSRGPDGGQRFKYLGQPPHYQNGWTGFDRVSPNEVIQTLQSSPFYPGDKPNLPDVYVNAMNPNDDATKKASYIVFRSHDGDVGVMQVLGTSENPRGVKIRYKLVQNSVTTVTPVSLPPANAVPVAQPAVQDDIQCRLVATEGQPGSELLPPFSEGPHAQTLPVLRNVVLSGEDVESAGISDFQTNQQTFDIVLTLPGAQKFATVTAQNIGRQLAIVWRGKVVSAPIIQTPITGGRVSLVGNFTDAEARELLIILNNRGKVSTLSTNSSAQRSADQSALAFNAGDFALARTNAARATELDSYFAEAWVALGMASVRLGDMDQAKAAYEHALAVHQARHRSDPADSNQVFQQIYVLSLLGRSDEAQALLTQALTEYPDDKQIARLHESFASTEKLWRTWGIK